MGLLIGRAGRAVVAAGTGTGTMTLAGQWTDARRAMGRLHRSGPRRPPESSPPSPGGSSSASRLSAGAALARAGSVACYAAGVLLAAFAALVALPLQAQAQKTTFVSNTGQSTATSLRGIGPTGIGSFFYSQAQRFSTGSNEGGYTLSAIKVQADNFESASSPRVSIYTVTSDNPGTLLYVLTNPATLNDDAINTFRAPANATLEEDTNYFVVFEALGSGSNLRYDLKGTVSANEDSGTASGWSIADTSRERATNSGNWSSVFARLKIAVRGTIPPAISIADASAAENAGHLLFEVTLSRSFRNTVKVDFETISGGTATAGEDYYARRTYTHVILAGDRTAQMGFALIEDTVNDDDETVMVRLSNAREVDAYGDQIKELDITRAEATGTITAPSTSTTNVPGLTIRIRDATGSEDSGWLLFKVKLSKAYDDYVCYDFETISGGTATEGTDYLKFPKATYWMQIGKRVDKPFVRIINDRVNESDETVKVEISNARLCNDPSQTVSITRDEATGTISETSALRMASSDDGDGDDALLARVGDVTPEAATAALFGGDALTGDQLAAMDQLGNRNGAYDLGDLLSWRARCGRDEVSCGAIVSATDAGSLPASPAMPPTKRNGRTSPRRRGGARAGRRSGRNMGGSVECVPQRRVMRSGAAGRGPGRRGPAGRRATGWIRALALGLVASVWGCGIGDNPVQPAQPDPGPLHVQLTVPPEARDIGAMLVVEGPGIDSLSAPGFELIQADEASSNRREAIIAGSLSTGPVLQVWVPDRRQLADYRVELMQVAGDDYGLKDLTQYGIAISR